MAWLRIHMLAFRKQGPADTDKVKSGILNKKIDNLLNLVDF